LTTVSGGEVTVVGGDVVVSAAVFAAVAAGNVFIIVSVRKIWCQASGCFPAPDKADGFASFTV